MLHVHFTYKHLQGQKLGYRHDFESGGGGLNYYREENMCKAHAELFDHAHRPIDHAYLHGIARMSLLSWLATAKQPLTEDTSSTASSVDENELPSDEPEEHSMQSPAETPEPASLIPVRAHQPFLKFPLRSFGKQQRAFCATWYSKYHGCITKKLMIVFYAFIAGLSSFAAVWMLLNIYPAHRSPLKSIQLLTVVKATHLTK